MKVLITFPDKCAITRECGRFEIKDGCLVLWITSVTKPIATHAYAKWLDCEVVDED